MTNTSNICSAHFEVSDDGQSCPYCMIESQQLDAPVQEKELTKQEQAEHYRRGRGFPTKREWIEGQNDNLLLGTLMTYEVSDYVEDAFLAGWQAAIDATIDNLSAPDVDRIEELYKQLEELYAQASKKRGW